MPSHASTPEPLRPSSELLAAWLLVLVETGVTHGYDMRRELAAHRLVVDYPSVYRMLNKLQRDGQLRSRWGKTVAGPRRRVYEITPAGLDTLATMAERISAVSQTHDTFFEAYAQIGGHPRTTARDLPEAAVREPSQPAGQWLALDRLALSVEDLGAMQAFLCDHVGMRELARGADAVLVGAAAGAAKLSLIPAEGPREPAALGRLVLAVADLQRAVAALPAGTEIQQHGPRSVLFEGPEGLGLAFALTAAGEADYDIIHVILRVADPHETATALVALGCVRRDDALHVGDKRITLEELPAWSDRPLLDQIAVRAESVEAVAAQAHECGFEIDAASADSAVRVVLPGPERITFEFFADKA